MIVLALGHLGRSSGFYLMAFSAFPAFLDAHLIMTTHTLTMISR